MDHEIGRVLKTAEKLAPGAMVIFTSDHGSFLGNHCLHSKGPTVYDEVAKVPFIIKPGCCTDTFNQKQNAVYNMPVSHIDLAPTIFEYMGIAIPKMFEGKSLIPMLTDPSERINDSVFIEFTRFETIHDGHGGLQIMRSVIDDRYKLSINLLDTDELYDNEIDPYEMKNLINDDKYAEIRNDLHKKIIDFMNRTADPFRGYQWRKRPWSTDMQEATWRNECCIRQRDNTEYEPRQLAYETGLEIPGVIRVDSSMT